MGDVNKLKRVGGKIFFIYVVMTLLACILGLFVAYFLIPDNVAGVIGIENFKYQIATPTASQFFMSLIPANPIDAILKGNVMQVLVFSVLVGIAMVSLGHKVEDVKRIFSKGAALCFKILAMVMEFSPLGICALMAHSVGFFGIKIFGALASFILADYVACLTVWFVLMLLPATLYTGIKPLKTMKAMLEIWIVAVSTTSSAVSMPITMRVCTERFKLPEWMVSFTVPLGTTINLAGAAVWKSVLIIFVARLYSLSLTIEQMIMIVLLSSLLSIAAPGIPGGGIVMGTIMLTLMGLPYDIMGPIAGTYRIIDMIHTPLNISGDVIGTMLVAKNEGIWSGSEFNNSIQ